MSTYNTLDTLRELQRDYQNKVASVTKIKANTTSHAHLTRCENRLRRYARYLRTIAECIHMESNLTGESTNE